MRIGCCVNMIAANPDGTGVEAIEELKEMGYDYIELPLAQMMALSEAEFLTLKHRVESSGLKCEACNNFFPPSIRLTGNEANFKKAIEYVQAAVSRVNELGAKIIVFGSSGAKNVPEGFPVDKAWNQIVELLREINGVIEKSGINVVIEPLNGLESNIVKTAAEGLHLAKEVDRSNIKLLVDYYHLSMENEDPGILLEAKDYIHHIHFAEPQGRVFPKGISKYDYNTFFNNLKSIEYKNRVSIEAYSKEFYNDGKAALDYIRSLI